MICPKCYKTIPDESTFCFKCGSDVSAISGASGIEEDIAAPEVPSLDGNTAGAGPTGDSSIDETPTIRNARRPETSDEDGSDGAEQEMPLSERYEIITEIGQGGFAVVYRARDRRLGRIVAIKRLLTDKLSGKQAQQTIERFKREAQAIANLNHRNIVQVFDCSRDAEGHYIVMEYIEGGTLRGFLKERGKIPISETTKLIRGICQGLSFAHKRKLIHRDIKPANILLARDGEDIVPKIVDFGLARVGLDSTTSITGYGMGTPYYMPPEQRRDAKNVNHTADIYALGKTIYEMVTGEIPDNVDPEMIPPPPQLARIILKCIKSRPEDRYFSVDELLRNLEELGGDAPPPPPGDGRKLQTDSGNVCPNCNTGNPEDVKFCENCGTGLVQLCPECERENSVHKQYCGGCGTDVSGFLQAQETLQQMEKLKSEKKWSRITKEFGLLPEELHLPGPEGQHLIGQLQGLSSEADSMLKERDRLVKRIEKALNEEKYEKTLTLVAKYQEIDPHKADINELPGTIGARIDDRDYALVLEQANQLESEEKLEEAIQVCEGYIEKHSDGIHADEIKQQISRYKQISKRIGRVEKLLGQAQFEEAEDNLKEIERLGAGPQLVSAVRGSIQRVQEPYSNRMTEASSLAGKRDLDSALKAATDANNLCPSSPEATGLLTSIQNSRSQVVALFGSSTVNNQKAQFAKAARELQQVRREWPSAPGLQEAEARLARTELEFKMLIRRAHSMIASKHPEATIETLERALILCPDSEEAKALLESAKHRQTQARGYMAEAKKKLEQGDYADSITLFKKVLVFWPGNEEARRNLKNAKALSHLRPKAVSAENRHEYARAGRLYGRIDTLTSSGDRETQSFLERRDEASHGFAEALTKEVARSMALAGLSIALLMYYTFVFADCRELSQQLAFSFLWACAGLLIGVAQFRLLRIILGPASILLAPAQALLFLAAYYFGATDAGNTSVFGTDGMLVPLSYAGIMATGSLLLAFMISGRDLIRNLLFSVIWIAVLPAALLCWVSLSAGVNVLTEQLIPVSEGNLSDYVSYSVNTSLITLAVVCLVTSHFAGKALVLPLYSSAINKMNQRNAYSSFLPFLLVAAGCSGFFLLIGKDAESIETDSVLWWAVGAAVLSLAITITRYVKPKDQRKDKGDEASSDSDDRQEKPDRLARLFTEVPLVAVSCAAIGAGVSYAFPKLVRGITLSEPLAMFQGTHVLFLSICALSFIVFLITGAMKSNRLLAVFSLPAGFIVIYLIRHGVDSLGWTSTANPVPGIRFLPVVAGSVCAGLLIPKRILNRSARSGGIWVGILSILILGFGVAVAHRWFDFPFKSGAQRDLTATYGQVQASPTDATQWQNLASEYARIGAIGNNRAFRAVARLVEGSESKIAPATCDFSRVPEMLTRVDKLAGRLDPSWVEELRKSAQEMNIPDLPDKLAELQKTLANAPQE